jgi:exodeoxyribonuclease VII large subunit
MPESQGEFFAKAVGQGKPRHIYTVSQLTQDIKLVLESAFGEVWVEGEVSGLGKIATGTTFFTLKDSASLLKCVIFYSQAKNIKFELKDGLKVICFGRISVYEKSGQYQLYVEKVEPKGIGSQQLALEQLKAKLEKEGLFSPEHKRPIPYLPSRIGIVTSQQGAAIRDILKVVERRFCDVHIIVSHAQVQGEGAKDEIARAIDDLNLYNEELPPAERIEVMIVGRGGGSIEDLWAFNEEVVARAIYNSKIPVVSAVGHERDWTIADLVGDVRAPTPSVAAELVVPKKEDLESRLDELKDDLKRRLLEISERFQEDIDGLALRMDLSCAHILELDRSGFQSAVRKLMLLNPSLLLEQHRVRTADLARQIYVRIEHYLRLKQTGFSGLVEKLSSLSPLNILGRGYSITFKMPQEEVVKEAEALESGDTIKTRLHKGEVFSRVTRIEKKQGGG